MRRTTVIAVACALIASVTGAVPAASAPDADLPGGVPEVRVPVLNWTACAPPPDVRQCATADVPLDYKNPAGAKISLGLTRVVASGPAPRIGSLFVNPGGPGGGIHGFVNFIAREYPDLRARYDIVGFDPRGAGRSSPIMCQTPREYADSWEGATARPPNDFDRAVELGKQFNAACMRQHAALLPFVGTDHVARDMDVLRAAVGDPKLNYFGVSFGTFIGTVYASIFPSKTRVLALDGAYDPNTYTNRPYAYDRPQYLAVDAALGRFFEWCKRNQSSCTFGRGDPRREYQALQAALDANPIREADGRLKANGASLALEVTFFLGEGKDDWPTLAEQLVKAQNRDADAELLINIGDEAAFLVKNAAIECADRNFPTDLGLLQTELQRETTAAPLNGPAHAYGPPNYDHGHATACVQWPAKRLSRYAGPFDAPGSEPILVVGNTGDPDTPYQDAVTLSRTLDNARLLTVRGEGHTGFFNSSCAEKAVKDYLLNGTLPDEGRECPGDVSPTGSATLRMSLTG